MPVSKSDFNKLLLIITKAQENMPQWLDPRLKSKINEMQSEIVDLDESTMSENRLDTLTKQATTALKAVVQANKDGPPEADTEEKWQIKGYSDKGDCEKAAKNGIQGLEMAYKKKLQELLVYDINEGHLGCVYEKNILTKGDKFSFFFKYVRKKDYEAELHGIAIGCHSGSNYVVVDKNGKATTNKISAQKKNL